MLAKISILICLFFFNAISFIHAYEVSPGVLRTPDTQFENLEDYPFEPNYIEIDGLRITTSMKDLKMVIQFFFFMAYQLGVIYFEQ